MNGDIKQKMSKVIDFQRNLKVDSDHLLCYNTHSQTERYQMEQTLIVIRGVPGSGKTTKAQQIIGDLGDHQVSHYEADHFFVNSNDEYVFDATKLRGAHEWCKRQTRVALDDGDIVIVSNTFTQNWELQEYIDMALAKSIPIQIIQCDGDWQNVHGVPDSKVQVMRDRFESNHKIQAIWQSHEKQHLITFA